MDIGDLYTDGANRLNICYDIYCNEIYGVLYWIKRGEDKFTYNEIDNLHKIPDDEIAFALLLSNYVYNELNENTYFALNELSELLSEENSVRLKMLMNENEGLFFRYVNVSLKYINDLLNVFKEHNSKLKMIEYKNILLCIKENIC